MLAVVHSIARKTKKQIEAGQVELMKKMILESDKLKTPKTKIHVTKKNLIRS